VSLRSERWRAFCAVCGTSFGDLSKGTAEHITRIHNDACPATAGQVQPETEVDLT
jgi:hypothetical protein